MKNMFYEKFKKEIKKQTLMQESLEKLKKIYFPKIFNLLKNAGFSEENGTIQTNKVIDAIFKLDPTHNRTKGGMFAKNLFKIYYDGVKDLVEQGEIARETNLFANTIREYNKLIEENPPKEIGIPMKSLNNFESIEEVKEYVKTIEKKIREVETKRQTKGLDKLQPIHQNEDFKAYFIEDEGVMINTFGGISDWCVSKGNGHWGSYTSKDGLMIVFQNLIEDISDEERFILATLRYDDETFHEINNLKNSASSFDTNIYDLEDDVIINLKSKYNVNRISEIGDRLYEYKPKITLNGNEYSQEDIDKVFDNIFEAEAWTQGDTTTTVRNVGSVSVDSKDKSDIFYDFVEEYGNFIKFEKFEHTSDNNDFSGFSLSVVPPNGFIKSINVMGENFYFEIKKSVTINSVEFNNCYNDYQVVGISGMDGGNNKIKNLTINEEINGLTVDDFNIEHLNIDGKYTQGLEITYCKIKKLSYWAETDPAVFENMYATTIKETYNHGNYLPLINCEKYIASDYDKEITICAYDSLQMEEDITEQLLVFDESIEKIEIVGGIEGVEKITLTGNGLNDLKELAHHDDSLIVELPYEIFLNLEKFDGERELIKFTDKEIGTDQNLIQWEIFDRFSRFLQ